MQTLTNKVQLIGRLGADPEIKSFENGKMITVNIATNSAYTDKDGKRIEDTQWHRLVGWDKVAEIGEKYWKKGTHIAIDGQLKNRSYDDKEGKKQYITEVIIDQFHMLDKKPD